MLDFDFLASCMQGRLQICYPSLHAILWWLNMYSVDPQPLASCLLTLTDSGNQDSPVSSLDIFTWSSVGPQ